MDILMCLLKPSKSPWQLINVGRCSAWWELQAGGSPVKRGSRSVDLFHVQIPRAPWLPPQFRTWLIMKPKPLGGPKSRQGLFWGCWVFPLRSIFCLLLDQLRGYLLYFPCRKEKGPRTQLTGSAKTSDRSASVLRTILYESAQVGPPYNQRMIYSGSLNPQQNIR